jgi:hypothetical protein
MDGMFNLIQNMNEIKDNANDYCITNRVSCPVTNLENIESLFCVADDKSSSLNCTICIGVINQGDQIIKLSCGHIFHRLESECLEDCSILNWFQEHKTCPVCKQEVIIRQGPNEKNNN